MGEGKFMHYSITNEENFLELDELQEFKNFLAALKASHPVIYPKPIDMELVGSSTENYMIHK